MKSNNNTPRIYSRLSNLWFLGLQSAWYWWSLSWADGAPGKSTLCLDFCRQKLSLTCTCNQPEASNQGVQKKDTNPQDPQEPLWTAIGIKALGLTPHQGIVRDWVQTVNSGRLCILLMQRDINHLHERWHISISKKQGNRPGSQGQRNQVWHRIPDHPGWLYPPRFTLLIEFSKTLSSRASLLPDPHHPSPVSSSAITWTRWRLTIASTTAPLLESSTSWRRAIAAKYHTPLTKSHASASTCTSPTASYSIIWRANSVGQETEDWSSIQTVRNSVKCMLTRTSVETDTDLLRAMTPSLQNHYQITW